MKILILNNEVVTHLKAYRLENELTQDYMAGVLNISRTHYNQIENGKRSLGDQVAWDIFRKFGISSEEINKPITFTTAEELGEILKKSKKKTCAKGNFARSGNL